MREMRFTKFLESAAGAVFILFMGLIAFSVGAISAALMLPQNEKLYLFLTGIASNFSGALFIYLQTRFRARATEDVLPGTSSEKLLQQVGEKKVDVLPVSE